MATSTFTAKQYQQHSAGRLLGLNSAGPLSTPQFGDEGGKFSTANDIRHTMSQVFELATPDGGGMGVTIGATIHSVKLEWVSRQAFAPSAPSNVHEVALMAPDGHWDRSRNNALHVDNSTTSFTTPSVALAFDVEILDSHGTMVAETMPTKTGTAVGTTGGLDEAGTFATTIEVPAETDVKTIRWRLGRADVPDFTKPQNLSVAVYELAGNGRHFSPSALISTSADVAYSGLPYSSYSDVDFVLATAIPLQASARWIGLVIEGGWFVSGNHATQRLITPYRINSLQHEYLTGTSGSTFYASKIAATLKPNTLTHAYLFNNDHPTHYRNDVTTPMTTPWDRTYGTAITATISAWPSAGSTKSYGSADSGADDIFAGLESEVQAFVASTHYRRSPGRSWIGFLVDVPNADDALFRPAGTEHPTYDGVKLTLVWEPAPRPWVKATSRSRQRVADAEGRPTQRVKVLRSTGSHRVLAPCSRAQSGGS